MLATQSCPTHCDPTNCSPPGSSVHGILQARILQWVAISFSRGSSQLRDQAQVSCIACRLFTVWSTREDHSSLNKHSGFIQWPNYLTKKRRPEECGRGRVRNISGLTFEEAIQTLNNIRRIQMVYMKDTLNTFAFSTLMCFVMSVVTFWMAKHVTKISFKGHSGVATEGWSNWNSNTATWKSANSYELSSQERVKGAMQSIRQKWAGTKSRVNGLLHCEQMVKSWQKSQCDIWC